MSDYLTLLQQIIATVSMNHWGRNISKHHPDLYEWIQQTTAEYNVNTINESIYIILNGPPAQCQHGNTPAFESFNKGYNKFCKHGCICHVAANKDRHSSMSTEDKLKITDKYKKTMVDKYGVDNPSRIEDVVNKRKSTNIEKYGVDNPSKSTVVKNRIKQTTQTNWGVESPMQSPKILEQYKHDMLEKYGVDFPVKNKEVRSKIESTNSFKYGHASPFGSNDVQQKIKQSLIDRWGVDNPSKSPDILASIKKTVNDIWGVDYIGQSAEIRAKIKNSNLLKYGVEEYFNTEEFKLKSRETMLKKYDVPVGNCVHLTADQFARLNDSNWLKSEIQNRSVKSIADELSVDVTTIYNKLHSFEITNNNGSARSYAENEIAVYVESLGFEVIVNDRKVIAPKELDIVIPSANLAIEFCGIYWHSNKWRDDDYHYNKWKSAHDAGYQLLTIYDDEYEQNKFAVLSAIAHKLGVSTDGIAARKLNIVQLFETQRIKSFYDKHHVQGWDNGSTVTYALVSDDVDVAMMSFERINDNSVYLTRYATAVPCAGGASRLFSYFLRAHLNITSVISFADLRWSNGSLYHKLNFTLDRVIPPDYQYIVNGVRKHKFNFRKHRLFEMYGDQFDMSDMTEREITNRLGFLRIYDCGKLRFVYNR